MLIFDIGANVGSWAKANASVSVQATIIAVEASPSTFQTLVQNTRTTESIVPLHFAVCQSDSASVTFFHCSRESALSTLNKD